MKRFTAIFLVTCGAIVVLWTFLWLFSYFIGRGLDVEGLEAAFSDELLYWVPVLVFCIPGFLLIHHGRRLLDKRQLHSLAILEVAILFAIIGVIAALVLPMDNFSFTAASIIANGTKTAEPLQTAVEAHYSKHQRFPDSTAAMGEAIPEVDLGSYIQSIDVSNGGRIVITFDTRNINWGWAWWHYLLFRKPNDLTGLTLVLVPSIVNELVIWDECSEGTAPQRNRHFTCSGHQ